MCDCSGKSDTTSTAATSVVSDTTTTNTFGFMYSFIPHFSYTTTSYVFQYLGMGESFSMATVDVGMCYGNCLLTAFLVISFIAIVHRGLNLFAVPAIFHHIVNGIYVLSFFIFNNFNNEIQLSSNAKTTTSGMITTLILTYPHYVTLGLCFLGMFGVVQWNYKRSQINVEHALLLKQNPNRSKQKYLKGEDSTLFQKNLQQSFNRMDTLYFMLNIFRYSLIAGMCGLCYRPFTNDYSAPTLSSFASPTV